MGLSVFPEFRRACLQQAAIKNKKTPASKPKAAFILALGYRNCPGIAEQAGTTHAVPF
jgi:hypothetical protein